MARKPAPPYPPPKPINYVGRGYAGPPQRALPAPSSANHRAEISALRAAITDIQAALDAAQTLEEARDRVGAIASGVGRLDRVNVRTAHCPHENLETDASGGPVTCRDCQKTWLRREDVR